MNDPTKVRNGSWVGRVELGGRVGDLDPSLLNSRNLSWVGQVGQVEFGGRVNYLDLSAPFCETYLGPSNKRTKYVHKKRGSLFIDRSDNGAGGGLKKSETTDSC